MSPARIALAPWWLVQLGTRAKAFDGNPILGSASLNRRGLHVARVRLAEAMAARRRRALSHLVSREDAAAFARDGFVMRRDFLPPETFAALRAALLTYRGHARETVQGDTVTRRIAVNAEALAAAPALAIVLADPVWRGLIRYVGSHDSEPLTYIQTILAGVREGPRDPQVRLHSDTFHATVKAWLFLSDVDEESGPFRYVPGSHRLTPERLAWERAHSVRARELDGLSARGSFRVAEEELGPLGLPPARSFAVPANTLIVADTHGFHARAPSLRPSLRVELWAYGRRNPFLPWAGLDPFSLPFAARRHVEWMWAARDRLERFIGQPWRDVGRKRPTDSAG